jgi:hypothetical protein
MDFCGEMLRFAMQCCGMDETSRVRIRQSPLGDHQKLDGSMSFSLINPLVEVMDHCVKWPEYRADESERISEEGSPP